VNISRTWLDVTVTLQASDHYDISDLIQEAHDERIRLRKSNRLLMPPGVALAKVSRFLLPPKAWRTYIRPIIADMQEEYCLAISKGDLWHARWIALRGHLQVFFPGGLLGMLSYLFNQIVAKK
jgi:hypothetical protein